VVVGVAGVFNNLGSGHALTHGFSVFGYHETGFTGVLFLYGVVGAAALFGPAPLLAAARRTSRRGHAARRGLKYSRRQTQAIRQDRDLLGQTESAHSEAARMQRFSPLLADAARFARHSPGDRWFVDETAHLTAVTCNKRDERHIRPARARRLGRHRFIRFGPPTLHEGSGQSDAWPAISSRFPRSSVSRYAVLRSLLGQAQECGREHFRDPLRLRTKEMPGHRAHRSDVVPHPHTRGIGDQHVRCFAHRAAKVVFECRVDDRRRSQENLTCSRALAIVHRSALEARITKLEEFLAHILLPDRSTVGE
jgi:hypothetical protein